MRQRKKQGGSASPRAKGYSESAVAEGVKRQISQPSSCRNGNLVKFVVVWVVFMMACGTALWLFGGDYFHTPEPDGAQAPPPAQRAVSSKQRPLHSAASRVRDLVTRGPGPLSLSSVRRHSGMYWRRANSSRAFSTNTYKTKRRSDGNVVEETYDLHVQAYVTPWNNHGYTIAEELANKFTIISPVWLRLVPAPAGSDQPFAIDGAQDIDSGWIQRVTEAAAQAPLVAEKRNNKGDSSTVGTSTPAVRIVPRFIFSGLQPLAMVKLLRSRPVDIGRYIAHVCRHYGFDGATVEVLNSIQSVLFQHQQVRPAVRDSLVQMFNAFHISSAGGSAGEEKALTLILVVPPNNLIFGHNEMHALGPYVSFFQLMTYDAPLPRGNEPGPNAPLDWVRKAINDLKIKHPLTKRQVLLGLNFYGYNYELMSPGARQIRHRSDVTGPTYLDLLRKNKPKCMWNEKAHEHECRYIHHESGSDCYLYFPTLASIQDRLKLARELKLGGVAIWEIGQGLDYFYDLL